MLRKICGIYKIENLINNKVYIGQSRDIKKRWREHMRELNNKTHRNQHLISAWHKYGFENFSFEILEECDEEILNSREVYWMNYYNSLDKNYGYNLMEENPDGTRKQSKESVIKRNTNENGECTLVKDEEVIRIKKLYSQGYDIDFILSVIDNKFINYNKINSIVNLNSYINIGTEYNNKLYELKIEYNYFYPSYENIKNLKLDIINLNNTYISISKKYNLSKHMICKIAKLELYKNICDDLNDDVYNSYNIRKNRVTKPKINKERTFLSDKDIISIKQKLINGNTNKELAKEYNVNQSVISNIKMLKDHTEIGYEYNKQLISLYEKGSKSKLNNDEILKIKYSLCFSNGTNESIAEEFNIDPSTISRMKNLKVYKNIGQEYNAILQAKYIDKNISLYKELMNNISINI